MKSEIPTHFNTEKALIGCLLMAPDNLTDIVDIVRPEDFITNEATAAFSSILQLWQAKEAVDFITVSDLAKVDIVWLSDSTDLDFQFNIKSLAAKVSENASKRRIYHQLTSLRQRVKSSLPEEILQELHSFCSKEIGSDKKNPHIVSVIERLTEIQKRNRERGAIGTATGFNFFERKYIQLVPGHMWTIGAYTSVGKTALMVEMICRILKKGSSRIVVISTEMTEEQITARILANMTCISTHVILSGEIHLRHETKIDQAIEYLQSKPLLIYDNVYSLPDIAARLRKAEMQGGVDVVFIDYLQNCTVPGASNEYSEMRLIAKELQALAKTIRASIVCLSQIPNNAAKEDAGILEFKGAGEIAAVSDVGLWLKRDKKDRSKMLCEIRKNRHGQLGKQIFQFENNWTKLNEKEDEENE